MGYGLYHRAGDSPLSAHPRSSIGTKLTNSRKFEFDLEYWIRERIHGSRPRTVSPWRPLPYQPAAPVRGLRLGATTRIALHSASTLLLSLVTARTRSHALWHPSTDRASRSSVPFHKQLYELLNSWVTMGSYTTNRWRVQIKGGLE